MPDTERKTATRYNLDEQVGYLLRLASQRHALIFHEHLEQDLTPTQFSTLIRLSQAGEVSQNHLGRLAAMDVATTKGVVDRLKAKSLVTARPDPGDKRRSLISLTPTGKAVILALKRDGLRISDQTLSPLDETERETLLALLRKIV